MKIFLINKLIEPDILKNFFWRAIQIAGKEGVSFVFLIFAAQILTTYNFGLYNYLLAIVFLLMIFSDFGISTATSKFVAQYIAEGNKKERLVIFNSGLLILVISSVVFILFILFRHAFSLESARLLLYISPLIFLCPLTSLFDGVYRGKKEFRLLSKITVFTGVVSVIVGYLLINFYGIIGALLAQDFLYLLLLVLLIINCKDYIPTLDFLLIKKILSYSIVIGIAGIGFFLFSRINTLILGHFGYITEVGYYELVNKLMLILILPWSIFSQVISPEITSLFTLGQRDNILKRYKLYLLLSGIFAVIIACLVYVSFPILSHYLLPKYSNPEVITIMNLLLIIFVSQCMSTVSAVGFSTASGHAKLNMIFLLIFGLINVPLTIFLVIKVGFLGAVYANVIVKLISDISFMIYYYKKISKYE